MTITLCGLISCEEARRNKLTDQQGFTRDSSESYDDDSNREDRQSNVNTDGQNNTDYDRLQSCEGESVWSRMTPERLRPLTRSEIEQVWVDLLIDESSENDTPTPCPDYIFEVNRDQLGEYQSAQTVHVASELNDWASTVNRRLATHQK